MPARIKAITDPSKLDRSMWRFRSVARRVFEWARRFSKGRTSIEDDQRSGRPVTKTDQDHVERVRKLISEDARITCDSAAEQLDISHVTAHQVITSVLGLRKLDVKFVPHLLTEEQKRNRVFT